jgi:predicted HicB family RNase H-like nuclease
MNDVKVFPLRMSAEFHQKLVKAAQLQNKSLHQYIIEVLQAKVVPYGDHQNK